jgi:hypothetical protein
MLDESDQDEAAAMSVQYKRSGNVISFTPLRR